MQTRWDASNIFRNYILFQIPVADFFGYVFGSMPPEQLAKVAYIDGVNGETLTYGKLKADALAFSRGLRNPTSPWGGLKRRQIACIFGANSLQLPALVFGLLQSGAGLTPSNPSYSMRELSHMLKSSGSVLLLAHSSVLETALAAAEDVGLPRSRIILMDDARDKGFVSVAQIIAEGYNMTDDQCGGPVVFTEKEIKGDPILLPYSSGVFFCLLVNVLSRLTNPISRHHWTAKGRFAHSLLAGCQRAHLETFPRQPDGSERPG
jgi:acyl-CoA synthetase (AMP-forming)/AMP-acid ligase II